MNHVFIILPRDGLFLKDGREWATSASGHAHSFNWPFPSTLTGAMRTAFGQVIEAKRGKSLEARDWLNLAKDITLARSVAVRRPISAREQHWTASHRCWPVPADALFLGKPRHGTVVQLNPRPPEVPTLSRDDAEADAREALWRASVEDQAKPGRSPTWWGENCFLDWLSTPQESRSWSEGLIGLALPRRVQSHVGIDPLTRTARPQILFAHDLMETLESGPASGPAHEWALGCEIQIQGNKTPPSGHVTLGGSRSTMTLVHATDLLFTAPTNFFGKFSAKTKGLRVVAATPLLFERGWLPDGFSAKPGNGSPEFRGALGPLGNTKLILRAALVPRPAHVSGWDMALRQPKPTARLVPPGAVYFFVKADGSPFTDKDAKALWFASIGGRTIEGFGRIVPGVWNPLGGAK